MTRDRSAFAFPTCCERPTTSASRGSGSFPTRFVQNGDCASASRTSGKDGLSGRRSRFCRPPFWTPGGSGTGSGSSPGSRAARDARPRFDTFALSTRTCSEGATGEDRMRPCSRSTSGSDTSGSFRSSGLVGRPSGRTGAGTSGSRKSDCAQGAPPETHTGRWNARSRPTGTTRWTTQCGAPATKGSSSPRKGTRFGLSGVSGASFGLRRTSCGWGTAGKMGGAQCPRLRFLIASRSAAGGRSNRVPKPAFRAGGESSMKTTLPRTR